MAGFQNRYDASAIFSEYRDVDIDTIYRPITNMCRHALISPAARTVNTGHCLHCSIWVNRCVSQADAAEELTIFFSKLHI